MWPDSLLCVAPTLGQVYFYLPVQRVIALSENSIDISRPLSPTACKWMRTYCLEHVTAPLGRNCCNPCQKESFAKSHTTWKNSLELKTKDAITGFPPFIYRRKEYKLYTKKKRKKTADSHFVFSRVGGLKWGKRKIKGMLYTRICGKPRCTTSFVRFPVLNRGE